MNPTTRLIATAAAIWQVSAGEMFTLPIWIRNTYAMIEMPVGTPPVTTILRFDTGSATSWIVDKECAEGACPNHSGYPRNGYDQEGSTTGIDLNKYISMTYLGGKVNGNAVSDVFDINGHAWNQTFLAANESSWATMPGEGFLGLAFNSIANPPVRTMVETLMEDGLLEQPRFAIYYGKEFNNTGNSPGEGVITIGRSEEQKYVEGDVTWLPVKKGRNGSSFELWSSKMRRFTGSRGSPNGTSLTSKPIEWSDDGTMGVFDTGAGSLSVPDNQLDAIYESIGWPGEQAIKQGKFVPLCSYFNSSWSVTFSFSEDGVEYTDLVIRGDQLRGNPGFMNRQDVCFPPFSSSGNNKLALFGTAVIRNFYSIFDFGGTKVEDYKPRIGLGSLKKVFAAQAEL